MNLGGIKRLMNEQENKVIDKIEKLLALAGSDNENEARAAMIKAQELMAKYEIDRERVQGKEEKERPVMCFSGGPFKDQWINMVAVVIAENFRCRCVAAEKWGSGGAFRIRFYGYEEDAEICINIFNYAVKVVRKRFVTLRAIYAEAGREFRKNEKMNYISGFCQGLDRNFAEQKQQSQSFALALVVPKEVDNFVNALPGIVTQEAYKYERNRENALLRRTGYVDGKAFQNAGDKERLAEI